MPDALEIAPQKEPPQPAPLAPGPVAAEPELTAAEHMAGYVPTRRRTFDMASADPDEPAGALAHVDKALQAPMLTKLQQQRGNRHVQRLMRQMPRPPVQRVIIRGSGLPDHKGQTPENLLALKDADAAYNRVKEMFIKLGSAGVNMLIHNTRIELGTANPDDKEPIMMQLEAQRDILAKQAEGIVGFFESNARSTIDEMLGASDKAIADQGERFGLSEDYRDDPELKAEVGAGTYTMAQNDDSAKMAEAAQMLVVEHSKLMEVQKRVAMENAPAITDMPGGGSRPVDEMDPTKIPELVDAKQRYEQVFAGAAAQFPVLATFKHDPTKMAEFAKAGTSPAAATMLGKELAEKRKNIRETRENLGAGKLKIWSLNNIVQGTKAKLSFGPDTLEGKAVDEHKADKDSDERVQQIAVAALSITLGILSAVATAGGSLVVAGVAAGAGAALSTTQLMENVQNYQVESAASNTALDKAASISQTDPSLFWLAVDLIAAGLDIFAAGKAFKAMVGPIRTAMAARRAVEAAKATGAAAKAAEAAAEGGEMAIEEINKLAKSIEEMEAAAKGAGVPDGVAKKIKSTVEGPTKAYVVDPNNPLSSAGFKGSLAEKGAGFGVYDGFIPGVQEKVVIKVYPDTDEFKEVFGRELRGAQAAGQTGIGPKCFGEVQVGPGKKAFAMEKVSGSMPEVTAIDELEEAVAKAKTPDEAAKAQSALDKATKEAAQVANTINQVTVQDVRAYGERVLRQNTYVHGDLQGLVDGGGRWRPIDFQGHMPLPDKLADPAAYAKALADHEYQLQQQINMLLDKAPKPLPAAPGGTLPPYRLPPGAPGGAPVQPFRRGQRGVEAEAVTEAGPQDLGDRIEAQAGQGKPLTGDLAQDFSSHLGSDLSGVRVHTGAEADDLAQAVDAVAFTTGQDIFFSAGSFAPESDSGRHLLAHEVAHTVQQAQGPVAGTEAPGGISVSQPSDAFEQAAEATAQAMSSGSDGPVAAPPLAPRPGPAEPTLQRAPEPSAEPVPLEDKPAEEPEEVHNITIDEAGVTTGVYNAPSYSTKDEVLTPTPDTKPEENLVDVTGKVVATFSVTTNISLPTVPSGLTECQTKRVQDAINNQLKPHEDAHVAAMKGYDGTIEEEISVKRVAKASAIAELSKVAKAKADEVAAKRKAAAQKASDDLDVPPFVITVDLNCKDEKKPDEKKPGDKPPAKKTAEAEGAPGMETDQPATDSDTPEPVQMWRSDQPWPRPVQRFITDTPVPGPKKPPSTTEEIQAAIDAQDKGLIHDIADFSKASDTQKRALVQILINGWTGVFDENALQRIFGSFGAGIWNLDANWAALFEQAIENGANPKAIPEVAALEAKFKSDVKGVALGHLNSNHDFVAQEAQRLAAPEQNDPTAPGPTQAAAAQAKIEEQQKIAELLLQAQDQQAKLSTIAVGWSGMKPAMYGQGEEGDEDREIAHFDPSAPPFQPFDNEPGVKMAHWAVVKKQYDELGIVMGKITDENPALYALMVSGKIKDFPTATPEEGRNQIMESFTQVDEHILQTIKAISEDDLDHRDLLPIHHQIMGGPGASGVPWDKPFTKMAQRKFIMADYQANEELISNLLGGAAMIAFLVAEFASGGLATLIPLMIGVGASAAPAAMSWEKYDDMTTAAQTAVKTGTELVTKEQISAVLVEAIINTAAALIDLYGAGKTFRSKIIRPKDLLEGMGAAGRAYPGIKELDRLPKAEQAQIAERAINELGVAEAVSKSGRSAEDLLYTIPADSPAYARLKAYLEAMKAGGSKSVSGKLATMAVDLAEQKITREEADQIVSQAIDLLGPKDVLTQCGGWQKLSLTLGNQSAAGQRLNAWRNSLWQDLQAYINGLDLDPGELENFRRTGSQGSFGSDLDMSSLGSLSSEHRDQARSFMAGRAGVDPGRLQMLLYADFFTDPRRMHLLDQLAPELRAKLSASQARKEQEMMLNLMFQDAVASGDEATQQVVKDMMKSANVGIVEVKTISKAEVAAFQADIDKLQQELLKTTDAGQQASLIEQISDRGAKINQSEGGGYFTGGGVRREVTEREKVGDFGPGGTAPAMDVPQRLSAMLDNALKLFHAAQGMNPAGQVAEVAGAIKSVGKYGGRFSAEFGKDGLAVSLKIPSQARFEALADKFDTWLLQAKGDADSLAKLGQKAAGDPAVKVMTLQERLALQGEGEAIQTEMQAAIGDFRQVLYEAHGALTKETGLAKLPANYAATQSYLLIQGKLLVIQDASSHLISGAIRALDADGGQSQEEKQDDEKKPDTPGGGKSLGGPAPGSTPPAAGL